MSTMSEHQYITTQNNDISKPEFENSLRILKRSIVCPLGYQSCGQNSQLHREYIFSLLYGITETRFALRFTALNTEIKIDLCGNFVDS